MLTDVMMRRLKKPLYNTHVDFAVVSIFGVRSKSLTWISVCAPDDVFSLKMMHAPVCSDLEKPECQEHLVSLFHLMPVSTVEKVAFH